MLLCEFAKAIPSHVADFLNRSIRLGRHFREETITDLIMAALVPLQRFGVVVQFPHEPTTGGDMDWLFVSASDSMIWRMRLQAKRLYTKDHNWEKHVYHALSHKVGRDRQIDILIKQSFKEKIPTIPYYIFYNPKASCSLAQVAGIHAVESVNCSDAHIVTAVTRPKTPNEIMHRGSKTLGRLHPYFSSLATLFCLPHPYFISPTPADAQAWATNERNAILAATRKEDVVLNDLPEIPEPGQEVPTSIRDIIGAYTVLPASNLPRPRLRARILFISGRR